MRGAIVCLTLLAAVRVAPAVAGHSGYTGGCTTSVAPGPQSVWTGTLNLLATTTPPASVASFECWVTVNGAQQPYTLVSSGTGVVAGTTPLTYTATPTDVVEICESATVDGHQIPTVCHP